MEEAMLYFAYGSNMDSSQMNERCATSVYTGNAKLNYHRLAFTRYSKNRGGGVADILPDENLHVWGIVYRINISDLVTLDRHERFNEGGDMDKNAYNREKTIVEYDGDSNRQVTVSIYIANKQTDHVAPSRDYMNYLISGAREWGFPDEYINMLENIKTN